MKNAVFGMAIIQIFEKGMAIDRTIKENIVAR